MSVISKMTETPRTRDKIRWRWVIQELVGIIGIIYFAFELYRSGSPSPNLAWIGLISFILSLEPMIEHFYEKLK